MNSETQTTVHKPKRKRSPAYPGIDLGVALDLARKLKDSYGESPTHPEVVFAVWDYKGKTGPGAVALAALKYFGLIEDEGVGEDRRVKLSDLALNILWDKRKGCVERAKAEEEAALNPKIHRKLWDHFQKSIPSSDEALEFHLKKNEKFSDKGAKDFIRQFRRTIAYVKLEEHDTLSGHEEDKNTLEKEIDMPTAELSGTTDASTGAYMGSSTQPPGTRQVTLWLSDKEWARLEVSYPLSAEAWDLMKKMLDLYKKGLGVPEDMKTDNAN